VLSQLSYSPNFWVNHQPPTHEAEGFARPEAVADVSARRSQRSNPGDRQIAEWIATA
jgi:hypothetical protein